MSYQGTKNIIGSLFQGKPTFRIAKNVRFTMGEIGFYAVFAYWLRHIQHWDTSNSSPLRQARGANCILIFPPSADVHTSELLLKQAASIDQAKPYPTAENIAKASIDVTKVRALSSETALCNTLEILLYWTIYLNIVFCLHVDGRCNDKQITRSIHSLLYWQSLWSWSF